MIVDVDELRKDMIDYYGTAIVNGFSMAVVDVGKIERVSDEELVRIALENGINLEKYEV